MTAVVAFENLIITADPLQQKLNQAQKGTKADPLRFTLIWDVSRISF